MQDTNPNQNQKDNKVESPKMVKPVTGSFKDSKKKLKGMIKQGRQNHKKAGK